MGLLGLCARPIGNPLVYHLLARRAAEFHAWEILPHRAETHGLAPLVYAHLKAAGISPPPEIQRQLQALYLRHRRANQIRTAALVDILNLFESQRIRAIVLKGAAVSHIVYPEPALRPMSDLDLLVSPSHAPDAQALLVDLGYRANAPSSPILLHRHLSIATTDVEGLTVQVEIHHRLLTDYVDNLVSFARGRCSATTPAHPPRHSASTDALIERARPFDLGDATAYALSHEDMLIHLCHHLHSHVNIWDFPRLIWTADVLGYAEAFASEINWAALDSRAPEIIRLLSLLHHTSPLSQNLLDLAGIRPGRAPAGLGMDYQGWPRVDSSRRRLRGLGRTLRHTLLPSEWWLRLRYNLGPTRPLLSARWVCHPLHILAQIVRVFLEHIGLPSALELAGQRAATRSREGESHEP